jgi:hypothetical protein
MTKAPGGLRLEWEFVLHFVRELGRALRKTHEEERRER